MRSPPPPPLQLDRLEIGPRKLVRWGSWTKAKRVGEAEKPGPGDDFDICSRNMRGLELHKGQVAIERAKVVAVQRGGRTRRETFTNNLETEEMKHASRNKRR